MPKDLKRNSIIIAVVLLFACIAVYPTQDTLMWHGKVKDTVSRGAVQEREIIEQTIDNQFAYWLDRCTGGIFHHKKEAFPWKEGKDKDPNIKIGKIERDVEIYSAGLTLGLDLEGGAELRYVIEDQGGEKDINAEKVKEIIRRRIDAMGLKEPIIQLENPDRIQIQLPGKNEQEIQRIKNIIESTGHLEFRLVVDEKDNETLFKQARAGNLPEGYHWYELTREDDGKQTVSKFLISDKIELTGEHIVSTGVQPQQNRELGVTLDFDSRGKTLFLNTTQNNIGRSLAIILDDVRDAEGKILRQGKLYSAPRINNAIYGSAVITSPGGFPRREAEDLRTTLQAGSLPATLKLEADNRVGPSLGRDSVVSGQKAILIGFVAVILFMIVYYHKAGIMATIALFLNLVLIVGALAVVQATLTLPGIAGIILTVGMAVDANVLIFERIREEMKKRGSGNLLIAVKDGYSRAIVTIVDANVTTLITAGVLYMVGTGAVKGFAATLSMGIVFSMFTAIFVTRVIFEFFITKGWIKTLGMFRLVGDSSIDFYQKARNVVMVSVALVAIGLVYCVNRGDKNFDTDFAGGTMLHVVTQGKVGTDDIRDLVNADYPDVIVQSITTKTSREQFSEFEIKTGVSGQARIVDAQSIPSGAAQDPGAPFAGGCKLKVLTDKPARVDEIKQKLEEKGVSGASVVDVGNKHTEFDIMVDISEVPKARDTVKNAFAELSVQADMARLLKDKLARGFPLARLTPEGKVDLEVDFGEPVATADLLRKLKDWGYANPSVTVKDDPGATEGTALKITATALDGDPESLQDGILSAYKGKIIEPFARVRSVDGHVAGVMKQQALVAIFLSLIFVIGYIWFRFELTFGFGAVIALIHDVGFTIGVLSILGVPFNLTIIAAILTIIGYSLNDTIVVFDRIRENLTLRRRERYEAIVNLSINQTLSRTLLTSLTTLVAVLSLLIFGGGVIRNFAIALMVGVLIGTYSSIFIASPFVVFVHKRAEKRRHVTSAAMATSKS